MTQRVPVLLPDDWESRECCVCRPLFDGADEGVPWVAFAVATGLAEILTCEAAREAELSLDEIEAQALAGLRGRRGGPSYKPMETRVEGTAATCLMRVGDDLTASDVLDAEFMAHWHHTLGAEELYVGIPSRGEMLIGKNVADVGALTMEHYRRSDFDGPPPLCSLVFKLHQGRLAGLGDSALPGDFGDDDLAMLLADIQALDTRDESDEDIMAPVTTMEERHGRLAFVVVLSVDSVEELRQIAWEHINAYIDSLSNYEDFGGEIVFDIAPTMRPTKSLRKRLDDLGQRFTTVCQESQFQTADGETISVTFELHEMEETV